MEEKYKLDTNSYGNLESKPDRWIYVNEIPELANISVGRYKNVPSYKVLQEFENTYGNYYKPIFKTIIHEDHIQILKDIVRIKQEKKQKKYSKLENKVFDLPKIAEAIYSISKEAKRQRDIQYKIANSYWGKDAKRRDKLVHYQIHRAIDKKEFIYELKNKCLAKLVKALDVKPLGHHIFPKSCMDYYEIYGFGFHSEIEENISDICLGKIENWISSERGRCINPNDARILLEEFLKTSDTKIIRNNKINQILNIDENEKGN